MKRKREFQLWLSALLAQIPHPSPNLLLSPVILQLLPQKGQGLVLWLLVFGFHHMTCFGRKNEAEMAVCQF